MKKVYIAYKLNGSNPRELRNMLEDISLTIENIGYGTFVFVRDIQNWKPGNINPKEIMNIATKEMKKCDIILSILGDKEKGEGMLIESGYMKALGRKLIVASSPESRGILIKGLADEIVEYKDLGDLKEKLKKILK